MARRAKGPVKKRVCLNVRATHAPAPAGASLMQNDHVVGTVTSGDWGHRTDMNLAYAFVDPEFRATGQVLKPDLLGQVLDVEVIADCVYDPAHELMRS